jgi:hypothetical protein
MGPLVRRMGQRQELAIWMGLKQVLERDNMRPKRSPRHTQSRNGPISLELKPKG